MPKGLGTQIIAGILGLLFVIGLVLLGRKLGQDLRARFSSRKVEKLTTQPTPTINPNTLVGLKASPTKAKQDLARTEGNTLSSQAKGGIREIPSTGAEAILFSTLLLPFGIYLRRQ